MTTPETNGPDEPTRQLSVSTAPPAAPRRWWSAVPHHLGRARTSTVVLALLFIGLYTLYLYVRPPDEATVPATTPTVQTPATTAPAEPSETVEPTTTAPTPSPTATPTTVPPEGTTEAPVGSAEPAPTTAGEVPTSAAPTTAVPTTAAPTASGAPGT